MTKPKRHNHPHDDSVVADVDSRAPYAASSSGNLSLGWRTERAMSLEEGIQHAVASAVQAALAPYLRRLSDPEPLVYSVHQAAKVLSTSTNTVRRLVDDGVLPTVPHMGQRVLIPRTAVVHLLERATTRADETAGGEITPLRQIDSGR